MIRGKLCNLRTFRSTDLDDYLKLASEIEVRGAYFGVALPTETSAKEQFDKDGFWGDEEGRLLVVDPESDAIQGIVFFFEPNYYDYLEIGYINYRPESRGKGVISEAVRLFADYLFDLFPVPRLQIVAEVGNVASRRVAEKAGFEYESTAKKSLVSRGKIVDMEIFARLR